MGFVTSLKTSSLFLVDKTSILQIFYASGRTEITCFSESIAEHKTSATVHFLSHESVFLSCAIYHTGGQDA
jgi:hypothetical protein